MTLTARADAAIAEHRAAGREFTAAGVKSFALERGEGENVLLMHGVPASSFLYRKVAAELDRRGMRATAFDLPGLGLADRPDGFDYSWSGLGAWSAAAVESLGLESFHLVVHDIGGPVGFELAAAMPDRVRSLTILNTLVAVDGFKKPWVMRPFEKRGLGEVWLASMNAYSIVPLMWLIGVKNRSASPSHELAAYARLLKRADRGRAFLRIMRSFEPTAEKQRLYVEMLRDARYPIGIVWGADDTALSERVFGRKAHELLPGADYTKLSGRHFFQEEQAPAIADRVARLVRSV